MKKRIHYLIVGPILIIVFLSLLVGLIVGCGKSSSPAEDSSAPVQASPVIGELQLNDEGRFAKSGDYIFMASDDGMYVINISDPTKPTLVATFEITNFNSYDIVLYRNFVYMTGYISESGYVAGEYIYVLDVSDPLQPKLANRVNADGSYNIYVDNSKIYAVAAYSGLLIYDLTKPETPSLEVYSKNSLSLDDVVASGNYAYVADYYNGFKAIRLSSVETDYKEVRIPIDKAHRITLSGDHAYVLEYSGKLHVIDITTPEAPTETTSFEGSYSNLFVGDDYLYLGSSLKLLDITDKHVVKLFKNVWTTAYHIITQGNYIYVTGNDVFQVLDKTKL